MPALRRTDSATPMPSVPVAGSDRILNGLHAGVAGASSQCAGGKSVPVRIMLDDWQKGSMQDMPRTSCGIGDGPSRGCVRSRLQTGAMIAQ